MAEEEKPKILVDAATVVEAITAENWNSEQTKRFSKQGIYRLNEAEMKLKFPETKEFGFAEGELTTVLHNVGIANKEKLVIKDSHSALIPDVYITDCELGDVDVINCKWIREVALFSGNTNFYIINSTTGDFSIDGGSTTGDFSIDGGSTTGYFSIDGGSMTGDFFISEKSRIRDFSISGQSTTGYFSIDGGSTTGYFSISEKSTTGDFSIYGESTIGYFSISEKSTTGDFRISEKSTTGYFSIYDESTTGYFSIKNSFTGNFFVVNSSSPLWEVENCFASFTFSKATIGQCRLIDCQIPQLQIQNQCEVELYVSNSVVNHLNFEQLSLGKNSIVSLSSVQMYLCNMFEFTSLGNLYFRNISPAKNTIDFFKNTINRPLYITYSDKEYNRKPSENNTPWENYNHKLKKYKQHLKRLREKLNLGIEPTPTFRIVKSSLGKTEFTECDLKRFRVEYKHSKLTEIFISGGTVPDDDLIIYGADENDTDPKKQLEWHEQKAAFFNQLKKVFSQVGNVYRETQYNSLSAKHQLQILVLNRRINKEEKQRLLANPEKNKKWKHKINRWWRKTVEIINKKIEVLIRPSKKCIKTFYKWLKKVLPESTVFDIITFYLNRYSNNHGASWGRAVVFTVLSTACAYIVYLCSVKVLGYGSNYVLAFDWELVAYYFSFIDITHKPDFMKDYGVEVTAFSRVVSFFSRILVGFCIYQFIAAFRRHGKQG